MESLAKHKSASMRIKPLPGHRLTPLVPIVGSLLSVIVALFGIFLLASWAEASTLTHGLQHVIIFLSGAGLGSSLIAGFLSKQGDGKR